MNKETSDNNSNKMCVYVCVCVKTIDQKCMDRQGHYGFLYVHQSTQFVQLL